MWFPTLALFLTLSSVIANGDHTCKRTQFLPFTNTDREVYVVSFNSQPCGRSFDYNQNLPFCENSGWGDKEASVACWNESKMRYGIGSYLEVEPTKVGFSNVSCTGEEEGLEECTVGNLTSHNCSEVGIVLQCFNVSQLLIVSRIEVYKSFEHIKVSESKNVEFCIIVWGPLTESVHVLVTTTDRGLAVADSDYHSLNHTLIFAPSNMTRSLQCVQIEIIDDSLAEDWEMFTVLLSTNSSTVNLTRHEFDVFIQPNINDSCTEGSVTVVSDVRDNLQLVEMCSSEGVWSPVCDNNWTLQDATVICRELGYQDIETIHYGSSDKEILTGATIIDCEENVLRLDDCSIESQVNISCWNALVQCDLDSGTSGRSRVAVGIIAGVIVVILMALVVVMIGVVIVIILKRKTKKITTTDDTLQYNRRYESANKFQGRGRGGGEKHLDNPIYNSSIVSPKKDETFELHLVNPLYDIKKESDGQPHAYAVFNSPEYAVPGPVPKSGLTTAEKHVYDYVDNTCSGSNPM